jgi:hypothetical protein
VREAVEGDEARGVEEEVRVIVETAGERIRGWDGGRGGRGVGHGGVFHGFLCDFLCDFLGSRKLKSAGSACLLACLLASC